MNTWLLVIIPLVLIAYAIYRWVKYGFSWFALGGILAGVVGLGLILYSPSSDISSPASEPLAAAASAIPTPIQEGARRLLRAFRGSASRS